MIASLGSAWEGKACGRLHASKEKAATQGLDAVKQIIKVDYPVVAEISLGGHDERFAELGKRETSGFLDRLIKVNSCKRGMHSHEILTAKLRRWIGKQNNPIKAPRPPKNSGIKRGGFIRGRYCDDPLTTGNAVQAIQ